jgi:1-acyl-sn-glycerol-3-phosphate acyltransferase
MPTLKAIFRHCVTHFYEVRTNERTIALLNHWPAGQKIITANHVSMIDGPLLALIIPEPIICPVAKEYCTGLTGIGLKLLERITGGKVIPLDRDNPTAGTRALIKAAKETGMSALIFPEGKINTDQASSNKPGAAWLSTKLNIQQSVTLTLAKHHNQFSISAEASYV